MMLVEETAPPAAALPVEAFRAYLRLGSGFDVAVDAAEDAALAGFLRAAIAAVEARTGKVLLTRRFRMRIEDWRDPEAQPLPLAPVLAIDSVVIDDGRGSETSLAASEVQLLPDSQRPLLVPAGSVLPVVPERGFVTILFTAGFGTSWTTIPADLAQAVMMLAAHYYEDRGGMSVSASLPFGVAALIERWRAVRTLAGRGGAANVRRSAWR
ncbi:hypothetical protein DRW48_10965 [Paracoccus suum]|uniref:Phage gp6-like head-tail connector protein n=1 Tax=Paracoccus suum TaxID=2259340 RepID=A0A344PL94_9RHOB|nr:head-tail connector protein [Paracoccus suum]AXC50149.1 hypothetical protein DRW48_10965 [Paracoccus suum]